MNNNETVELLKKLNAIFESEIDIPRIRIGKKLKTQTLINEEALLLAKFLRNETSIWEIRLSAS